MARAPTTALQRALAHLRSIARDVQTQGRGKLPSLQLLSEQAGVGYATMWRAVRRLRESGELVTRRGGGIYLAGEAHSKTVLSPRQVVSEGEAWERAAQAIQDDLLHGRFAPGALLPAQKQLASRYGVCYRTLHKALCDLTARGYVLPAGRGFRVPGGATDASHASLVMLTRADSEGVIWQSQMSQEFFRALERECSSHGIALSLITHPFADTGNVGKLRELVDTLHHLPRPPIGVLLRAQGMTAQETAMLAAELGSRPFPVAWLDESGDDKPPHVAGRPPNFRVFSLPRNTELAARMGRHVLALGHRRAVYISCFHQSGWSCDRLRSLEQVFAAAGGRVIAAVSDEPPSAPGAVGRDLSATLRRVVQEHPSASDRDAGQSVEMMIHRLDTQAAQLAHRAALRARLAPLLREAAAIPQATVWICGNDETALICLDYLQSRGIPVPGQLSVVGFDDTYDALCRGLTTYNFDRAGAIRAVMAYVLGTSWRQQRRTEATVIPGYGVQRGTLAACARSI
ncbi:MAG: GntR family transcriptional regulator [Chitinivibrionales bacterium]|nr:GntR family transcriptional regulator [Chitinivibrionales bacterium]